jgi:UDP-N-acetylmuramoyl-L-alanyl-D-glutamate--2,6-diaminopimelate ligase
VHFAVAAFTNLTRDHLDYHHTLEAYAAAKARLFFELAPAIAVIMVDDPFGEHLAHRVRMPVLRVSRDRGSSADIRPANAPELDARGLRCEVQTPAGVVNLDAPFVGDHNLANLLLTLGIASALGVPVDCAAAALARSPSVPGRLERCDTGDDDLSVLVDYAHTPDALERALRAIRPLTRGAVHCVFGCGGDRDRSKRSIMGQLVGDLADVAILTNDNPRSEAPEAIAAAVQRGLQGRRARALTELDRARAIDMAVRGASAGDVVLIAGKGHEPYQIVGDETRHFDDREQARRALAARRATARQKES